MAAIQDILDKFGDDTIQIIADNMRSNGQVATGKTISSLGKTTTENSLQVFGAPYIMATETGRGPRVNNVETDFKEKLIEWIKARGISFRGTIEAKAKSLAYLLNRDGTKLFREGGRKDTITPALSKERIDKLVKDIAEENFKQATISIKTAIDG
jgi:hypothetical protein